MSSEVRTADKQVNEIEWDTYVEPNMVPLVNALNAFPQVVPIRNYQGLEAQPAVVRCWCHEDGDTAGQSTMHFALWLMHELHVMVGWGDNVFPGDLWRIHITCWPNYKAHIALHVSPECEDDFVAYSKKIRDYLGAGDVHSAMHSQQSTT